MKKYQEVVWIECYCFEDIPISDKVRDYIKQYQEKGWQVEVQYSSCGKNSSIVYSALILTYTEE